jgi:hypothetical protein
MIGIDTPTRRVKEETVTMELDRNPVAAALPGNRKHKAVAKKNKAYFSFMIR